MSGALVTRGVSPAGDPAWIIEDYRTVRSLLTDSRINRFPHPETENPLRFTTAEILQFKHIDPAAPPPPDDLIRRMVATSFSARRMSALTPVVESIAVDLLRTMRRNGPPAEIRTALAEPLSSHVISELLGIPSADRERVRELSDASVDLTNRQRSVQADRELKQYMDQMIDVKLSRPGEDVLTDMLRFREGHPDLCSRELVIGLAAGLRFAGQINTVTLIERGVLLLIHHRERSDSTDSDNFSSDLLVEEVLRHPHPIQPRVAGVPRYAHQDLTVGDTTIRRGDLVILDLDRANLDREVFESPDSFHPARQHNPHLSFGHGPHYCVGASLARIELKAVYSHLFREIPNLRLDGAADNLVPRTHQLSGGLMELPVTWDIGS